MTVARPILFLGPQRCHAADLLEEHRIGWQISHGDVERAVQTIRQIVSTSPEQLAEMGQRARQAIERKLSKERLCDQFCDVLERQFSSPRIAA
jgi:hypothetical protein